MSGPPWASGPRPVAGPGAAPTPFGPTPFGPTEPAPRRPRPGREPGAATVSVTVDPGRVQIILWLLVGSLISLDVLRSLTGGLGMLPYTVTRFFDGNDRDSFGAGACSTLALAITVLLFGCSAAARRRDDPTAPGWRLLAWVAAFVFVDEITSMRRSLAVVLRERYALYGPERYTWALLYLPAALAVLVVLARHARRMAPGVVRRLVPGLGLVAAGIVGLEPFQAKFAQQHGEDSLSFRLLSAAAGGAELVGLTLILTAALLAAAGLTGGFAVFLAADPPARPPGGPTSPSGPPGPVGDPPLAQPGAPVWAAPAGAGGPAQPDRPDVARPAGAWKPFQDVRPDEGRA